MAQDKRTFMGGMDKDTDIRLIKNPNYTHALNVRVASSTDGTVGAVENIEGNDLVPTDFYSIDQEVLFVNSNGVYEEINPTTVFHEKVIRISGWEETNNNYSFSLYSRNDDGGSRHIGDFSWSGAPDSKNTAKYLISQFSEFSTYGTGIPIYDLNTWSEYTASVKLMTFNQHTSLLGGYLEIVIQSDTSGVNFEIFAESNGESSNVGYDQVSIPITNNGNATLSIQQSFDTGGISNNDTTNDGVVISPDGAVMHSENRTIYTIQINGIEPTSPADLNNIILYSYRLNDYNDSQTYDVEPFLSLTDGLFDASDSYPFSSNQNSISQWLLTDEFSSSKTILANDLPISFIIPSSNFFTTFVSGDALTDGQTLSIVVVGPPGVSYKLALATGSESLANIISGLTDGSTQFFSLNSEGSLNIAVKETEALESSSIELAGSIYQSYEEVSDELQYQLTVVGNLENDLQNLNLQFQQSQSDLQYQIALTAATQSNLDQAENDLTTANQGNDILSTQNDNLTLELINLQNDISSLVEINGEFQSQINDLTVSINELGALNLELGDEALIDASIISNLENNYDALLLTYNNYQEGANTIFQANQTQIISLQDSVSSLGQTITDLNTAAQENTLALSDANFEIGQLQLQIEALQQASNNVNISQLILESTFNRVKSIYETANEHYTTSANIYNTLEVPEAIEVYNEDFSPKLIPSDTEIKAYRAVFTTHLSTISTFVFFNGYIKLPYPNAFGNATAIKIPKISFTNSSEWLPGRTITLIMSFDAEVPTNATNKTCKVTITNLWDDSQNFNYLEDQMLYEEFTIYHPGGTAITDPQTFNFTIPADHDVNDLSLNNIVVISEHADTGGSSGLRAKLTHISIFSSNQGLGNLPNLYNDSILFKNNYLASQEDIQNQILSEDLDVNQTSNFVVPGFDEDNTPVLWNSLELFLQRSLEFSSSLQTYLYGLYLSYSNALTTSQADIDALNSEHQNNVNNIQEQLEEANQTIAELQPQVENLSSIAFANVSVINAPNVYADVITLAGVEPPLADGDYYNFLPELAIKAKFIIDGEQVYSEPFILIHNNNMNKLGAQAYSSTNNVLYYIRQNVHTSGLQWTFDIPGYGTQKANIFWSNFDQDNNLLDGSTPPPNFIDGINPFNLATDYDTFASNGAAQLIVTFDTSIDGQLQAVNQFASQDGFVNFVISNSLSNPGNNTRSNMIASYDFGVSYPNKAFYIDISTISDPTTY